MSSDISMSGRTSNASGANDNPGGHRVRGGRGSSNERTGAAAADPLQELARQLTLMSTKFTRNTAAFTAQRDNVASLRADVDATTQVLKAVDLQMGSSHDTFETEIKALGSSFQSGFANLKTSLIESMEASSAEHKLFMETIERYFPLE